METREDIKNRMWRDVIQDWEYDESAVDATTFDPVIDMILGACAVEFEKINQKLSTTQGNVLEHLIQTLTPDVLTSPIPAHAIMHTRSVKPEGQILENYQD